MSDYLLFLFPMGIVIILMWGAKLQRKGEYYEEAWSVNQSKALQAVAALMIILHHTVQSITNYGWIPKGPITNSFGILFTSIFFFFSGFGLYKSYKTKEHYLDGFLKKRLPKILIPFMVANIMYLIFVPRGRVNELRHVFTSILGFTLLNANAWFVVEILFLYIAFYVCMKKSSTERIALIKITVFTIILVAFSLLLRHDSSVINGHWFMGEWWYNTTLIFVLGLFVAKNEEKIKHVMMKWYRILMPVFFPVLVGWFILEEHVLVRFGYYQEWENHPGYREKFYTLFMQVSLCAIFVFFILLLNLKIEFKNRVLKFLGGISFEIYLIHDIFRWLLLENEKNGMPDALYLALTYGLSVAFAWFFAKLDKYLLDFCEQYPSIVFSFKRPKFVEEPPAQVRIIVNGIKVLYIIAFIGLLVTEGIAVCS